MAIELTDTLHRRVAEDIELMRRDFPAVRWVRMSQLHLTLSFMADVATSARTGLSAALEQVMARQPPVCLRMTRPGMFPSQRSPRVLWLGVDGGEALRSLQAEVAECVATVLRSAPERRRFHPHVTLGRCRSPLDRESADAFIERWSCYCGASSDADQATLFESILGPDGAQHRPVREFALAGEA